ADRPRVRAAQGQPALRAAAGGEVACLPWARLAGLREPGQISHISIPFPLTDLPAGLAAGLRDRYVLERELGRGGMATVYLARDVKHKRPIALKVLHPQLAASLGPERFEGEIRIPPRWAPGGSSGRSRSPPGSNPPTS